MAELISGPLMSVALIILAGIALRYALRMGKDREWSEGRPHHELSERVAALSMALEQAQRDQVTAQQNFERVGQDYENLKRSVDARDAEWHQQRTETAHKLARLEQLSQAQDASHRAVEELTSELDSAQMREAQLRHEMSLLQPQLQQLKEHNEGLQLELDQLKQSHGDFASQQAEWAQQQDLLNSEHNRLVQQLREAHLLSDELDQQQSQLKRDNERLQQQLHEQQARIDELSSESDLLKETHVRSERECAALQTELCEAELEVSRLQRHNGELAGAQDEISSLRNELSFQIQEEARLKAENRELSTAVSIMTEQSQELSSELATLRQSLETANQQVTMLETESRFNGQLRQENGLLNDSLMQQDKLIAELRNSEQALREQVADLNAQLVTNESKLEQMEVQWQQALEQTTAQATEVDQHKAQAQNAVARLAKQQSSYQDQLRIMQIEKDELARGLQREQQMVTQLKELLQAESDRLRKMQFELSHLELLRRDHQAVVAELAELRQQHAAAGQKLGQSETQLRGIQEKVLAIGTRAKHLEQELLQERNSTQGLRDENARLKKESGQLRAEKLAVEQLLKVHAETLQKLRADSLSIETLLERQAAVQSSLREHADRLRAVAADLRAEHDQSGMAQTAESMAKVLSFSRGQSEQANHTASRVA